MLKLVAGDLLRSNFPFYWVRCSVSTKYEIVKPRSYRRRLFEAALLPTLPETDEYCLLWKKKQEQRRLYENEYNEMELAYVKHVREWINTESFRMLAVCQVLPVKGRAEWLVKNQLRLKGLEFRQIHSRIMLKLLEGTSLEPLSVLFKSRNNCCLFGKELDSLRSAIKECKRYSWIEPLAFAFDTRILSVAEVEKLSRMASFEHLRLETINILETFSRQTPSVISYPSSCLSSTFSCLSSSANPSSCSQ